MVPLLLWWARFDQRQAQATSLLAIAPAGVIGMSSYAVGGVAPFIPAILVALGATVGAQLGAQLLRRLSLWRLKWTFISFVGVMAVTVMLTIPNRDSSISVGFAETLILLSIGILMGTSAGLFGIGGGIIAIPLIMLIFGVGDLEAKGISLIAMIPAALSGSLAHIRFKTASLRDGTWVAIGAVVAAPIGAFGAFSLPESVANLFFGGFALAVAAVLAVRALRAPKNGV